MGKTAKCVLSAEGCTEALSEDAYNGLLGIRNGYLLDDEFSCSLVAECFLFGYDSSENSCAAACNSMEAKLDWLDRSEREYVSLLL